MSSAQQRSAVPLDQQSVLPTVRGVPWWGAVLVATAITGIGAAIDASNTDGLGGVFKFCYLVGCVTAALAVRRRALFTAAAQPPLIAFLVGIIALYGLNAEQASSGARGLIFRVLLPIANDFPWMALTFLVTLGLVVARWYLTRDRVGGGTKRAGRPARSGAAKRAENSPPQAPSEARKKPATPTRDAAAPKSGDRTTGAPGGAASRASRPRTSQARASQADSVERSEQRVARKDGRPKRSGTRPPDTTRGASSDRTDAPVRAERTQRTAGAARPAPNGTANGRRSTAGAVFRAGAGEQIDAVDEIIAPPTAAAPVTTNGPAGVRPSAADERPRRPAATHRASTAQYQSTRARNRT